MPVQLALGIIDKLRPNAHAGTREVDLEKGDTIARVIEVDCVQCLIGSC